MEIPVSIVCLALASALGIQGWILKEIVDLKMKFAAHVASDTKPNYKIPLAVLFLALIPLLFLGCATAPAYCHSTAARIHVQSQLTSR